jgi:hypothetical protein
LKESNSIEDSVNNSKLAKLWFTFPNSQLTQEGRIEVPLEAMTELNAFFKNRLRFCLSQRQTTSSDGINLVQNDMELMKQSNMVTNKLLKIKISAPDGRREISQTEADRLIEFVSKEAVDVCRQPGKEN